MAPTIHDLKIDRSQTPSPSRAGWWVVIGVIALFAIFAITFFPGRSEAMPVKTIRVRASGPGDSGNTVLNATGYVTARRSATVSSKVTGKIVEIYVEEGDAVEAGQVVARLDPVNVQAFLSLAEAQLGASRAATDETAVLLQEGKLDLRRVTQLATDRIASQSDLDQAQARVDSLNARLNRLNSEIAVAERQVALREQDLDDLAIRAPFSGIVISKDAQPGEVISPVSAGTGFTRTGLCTLVDMDSLEIEVDVNESYINRVQADQPVTAVLDAYSDWKIKGAVIAIVPAADRQKATVKVRIRFDELDPRILPDMGVKVSFQNPAASASGLPSKPIVQIPRACLIQSEGNEYVFVVQDQIVERRAVQTEPSNGDTIRITAGLQGTERLVVDPPSELANGSLVKTE